MLPGSTKVSFQTSDSTKINFNSLAEQREYQAVESLINLFNSTFAAHDTVLVRGDCEPLYQPAGRHQRDHQVIFAHGFFSSALHEIAHWCIAGEERRKLVDYGYWYCPDGRDAQQQAKFEQVEIKPQAIEWALTAACGRDFGVSTDNLNGAEPDRDGFVSSVRQQLLRYFESGFPPRAQHFIQQCSLEFGTTVLTYEQCLTCSKDLS